MRVGVGLGLVGRSWLTFRLCFTELSLWWQQQRWDKLSHTYVVVGASLSVLRCFNFLCIHRKTRLRLRSVEATLSGLASTLLYLPVSRDYSLRMLSSVYLSIRMLVAGEVIFIPRQIWRYVSNACHNGLRSQIWWLHCDLTFLVSNSLVVVYRTVMLLWLSRTWAFTTSVLFTNNF